MIKLHNDILDKLSHRGILAYVAVTLAGDATLTTAVLAASVKISSAIMLEGLTELAVVAPEAVIRKDKKWICGLGGGEEPKPNADLERFRLLIDDLKKYWDYLNPEIKFSMAGPDGLAIKTFLKDHQTWTQDMWRTALNNRKTSVLHFGNGSRTEAIFTWVRKLGDYYSGPLNSFNKPVEGSGKHGKVVSLEQQNRLAREQYLTRHQA